MVSTGSVGVRTAVAVSNDTTCDVLRRCAVRGGNHDWSEFVDRFGPRLEAGVRGALRRAGLAVTRDRVEDLTQDVYCHLLASGGLRLRSFAGGSDGEALRWVGRLAANLALDTFRNASAFKRSTEGLVGLDSARSQSEPAVPELDPEQRLLAAEGRRRFWEQAARLFAAGVSTRDRKIFRMAVAEGSSSREIADHFGLTRGTVDSVMFRLRQRLATVGVDLPRRTTGRRTGAPRSRPTAGAGLAVARCGPHDPDFLEAAATQ